MGKPVFVDNASVSIVDTNTFKCNHCGKEFNPEDVRMKCPGCNAIIFERMRKKEFTLLFIDAMSAIGVPREKQVRFINRGNIPFRDLGVCTEMSIAIDFNFQLKFGGQYESFFVKETFDKIKANNFDNEKHRD
jgi:DNA-directed RNA polymerase subunit RPC12/RpoP